jgi:hypothetical protein
MTPLDTFQFLGVVLNSPFYHRGYLNNSTSAGYLADYFYPPSHCILGGATFGLYAAGKFLNEGGPLAGKQQEAQSCPSHDVTITLSFALGGPEAALYSQLRFRGGSTLTGDFLKYFQSGCMDNHARLDDP